MAIDPLSPEQLGNILLDIWRAGAAPDALGRFAFLQTSMAIPHQLTVSQWGEILMNLASADTTPVVLGRFVLAQTTITLAPGRQTSQAAHKTALPVADVAQRAEQNFAALTVQPSKAKPAARPLTKLTINGNSSVTVPTELVDKFLEVFGKVRLRQLINAVGASPRQAGVSRSHQVKQEIRAQLEAHVPTSYPHGIRVIQGG